MKCSLSIRIHGFFFSTSGIQIYAEMSWKFSGLLGACNFYELSSIKKIEEAIDFRM